MRKKVSLKCLTNSKTNNQARVWRRQVSTSLNRGSKTNRTESNTDKDFNL